MNTTTLRLATLCGFTLACGPLAAQGPAPLVLRLPASARALGVGDAFVAGRGSEVIFYNPAMIGALPGLGASVQRFGDASTLAALSMATGTQRFAAGIGTTFLDYGTAPAGGTRAALGVRGPELSSSLAAGVAVASQVKGIRVGISAKYAEERIGNERDGVPAFDVGVARDLLIIPRSTVALAVQNVGPSITVGGGSIALPTRATAGMAIASPPIATWFDLAATAAVTYYRDGSWLPAAGAELSYVPLDGWAFTGRVGARAVPRWEQARPLTLGGSVAFDRLALDYAYHAMDASMATHRVGVRLR